MTSGVNQNHLPVIRCGDHSTMADKEFPIHKEVCTSEEEQICADAAVDHSPLDKKILLKLDLIVLPVIAMLYLLVFIDRANIGNARVVSLLKAALNTRKTVCLDLVS